MITHVKPQHMKLLRELFPQKDGKKIIGTINWYLTDDAGKLIVQDGEINNVMIGEFEFCLLPKISENKLDIEELYLQV